MSRYKTAVLFERLGGTVFDPVCFFACLVAFSLQLFTVSDQLFIVYRISEQARESKIIQSAPCFRVGGGFLCGLVACNSANEPTTLQHLFVCLGV